MKRYYPNLMHQPLPRERRKVVRHDLIKAFNKSWLRRRFSISKKDLPYREKIRSEYRYSPRPTLCEKDRSKLCTVYNRFIRTTLRSPPRREWAIDLSPKRSTETDDFSYFDGNPSHEPITPVTTPAKGRQQQSTQTTAVPTTSPVKVLRFDSMNMIDMSAGRYLNFGLANVIRENSLGWTTGDLHLTVAVYVHKSPNEMGLEVAKYLMIVGRLSTVTAPRLRSNGSFLIGIYEGAFVDVAAGNEILEPFVTEMLGIMEHGLNKMCSPAIASQYSSNGRVVLRAFVVDPIAGSLLTCTALPGSQNACPRCVARGELQFNNNFVSFPTSVDEKSMRTNYDFDHCTDTKYHLAQPLIKRLPIGLVTQVVLDYKYTVCLGVMQRLWSVWTHGQLDYRINRAAIKRMDEQLATLGASLPLEFRSKPKPIAQMDSWTPYDWRQFLVYFAPIVLENVLAPKYFIHFVGLHVAVRIMINRNIKQCYNSFIVGHLLKRFVAEFSEYYGDDQVDYNVHSLLHYETVMVHFGSVEDVGGFDFDVLVERMRGVFFDWDIDGAINGLDIFREQRRETTRLLNDDVIYVDDDYRLHYNGFAIGTTAPDNYIITEKGVVYVREIQQRQDGGFQLLGKRFNHLVVLYQAPMTDEKFWHLTAQSYLRETIQLNDVIAKGAWFRTARGISVMPLNSI